VDSHNSKPRLPSRGWDDYGKEEGGRYVGMDEMLTDAPWGNEESTSEDTPGVSGAAGCLG